MSGQGCLVCGILCRAALLPALRHQAQRLLPGTDEAERHEVVLLRWCVKRLLLLLAGRPETNFNNRPASLRVVSPARTAIVLMCLEP